MILIDSPSPQETFTRQYGTPDKRFYREVLRTIMRDYVIEAPGIVDLHLMSDTEVLQQAESAIRLDLSEARLNLSSDRESARTTA